jgi:Ca-activated chloride channel homolog
MGSLSTTSGGGELYHEHGGCDQGLLRDTALTFAHPELLWALMSLPALFLWAITGRRRRVRGWQALAQRGRVPRDGTILLIGCVACLIVAVAQPRWGWLAAPPVPPGHDVVLMIDVSRSMAVEDAVPNRLAAAVEAAESLVNALEREPANRAAVVAFAGRGERRCPLTENLGAVLDALHRLRPGCVRPGGTDLGAALGAARDALGPEEHAEGRAIVIFSDGEDHPGRWSARVDRLREEDIVVHAVAIGDADQGHPVPDGKSAQPLLYHGEPVLSHRIDSALETIALRTDGSIVRLGLASGDLGTLYQAKIEPAARRRRESARLADRAERFPLFLVAALTFLMAACWPARRRWGWPWPWTWHWYWHWSLGSRRSMRKVGAAALLFSLAAALSGADDKPALIAPKSAARAVAEGQAAYVVGHLDQALASFETAIQRAPTLAVPRYNAAATLFQLGRYDLAHERYLEARERANDFLRTKIDYALGNTALAEGDIPGAIRSYGDCINSTARGAALDAVRRDAATNRQFALEQPQALSVPQNNSSDDRSKSQNPDRRRGPNPQGNGDGQSPDGGPENDPGSGGASPEAQGDRDQKRAGRRRMGGAGGGRTAPPGAKGDTPDDQLDVALEHIRDAQKRRLPDEEPPASANDDRKDW